MDKFYIYVENVEYSTAAVEQGLDSSEYFVECLTCSTICKTATGTDHIPAWFLKAGAHVFASPLAALMNMSLNSSVVPKQWRNANILPVT